MAFILFVFSWWFLSYSILHAFSPRTSDNHCRLFRLHSDGSKDVENNVDRIPVGVETNDFIIPQVHVIPHTNADRIRIQGKRIISTSFGISLLGTAFLQYKSESEYAIVKDMKRSMFSKYMNDSNLNVLEIGFGDDRNDGANFDFYPIDRNTSLVGIDPLLATVDESSRGGIIRRYQDKGVHLQLYNMSCDDLLFAINSFDVVVSTLVFCSIKEGVIDRAVDEIVRVLKPNGVFISLAKTQDVFNPVQQVVAHGCHLDRDTDQLLASHVGGDLTRTSGRYFRALLEEQYLLLPYQWPISRQYFAVYQK